MTYDSSFDQTRLDQLAQQQLGGVDISERLLFFGGPGENWLDLAICVLDNDEDFEPIRGSYLKRLIMVVLDNVVNDRAVQGRALAAQGVVYVEGSDRFIMC